MEKGEKKTESVVRNCFHPTFRAIREIPVIVKNIMVKHILQNPEFFPAIRWIPHCTSDYGIQEGNVQGLDWVGYLIRKQV